MFHSSRYERRHFFTSGWLVVRRAVEYVMTWRESKGGSFSVKSCYCSFAFSNRKVFPLGIVWNPWVLRRVSFFTWEAVWERILTLDQLKRRDWCLPSRCYLCKGEEESTNYILHCPKVAMLWQLIFAFLFCVQWVMSSLVKDALHSWHGSFVGKKRKKAWKATPLCLFWTLRKKIIYK